MKVNQPVQTWQLSFGGGEWPTSVTFLGSNRRLAAGNQAGEIFLWDLPETPTENAASGGTESTQNTSGKDAEQPVSDHPPSRRLDGHQNAISRLVATRDGYTLISASLDRTVRLWNPDSPATGQAVVVLDQAAREQQARGKSADEKQAILEAPGTSVETISSSQQLEGHTNWVKALSLCADERRLISGDDDCQTIVWDLKTLAPVARWHGYDRVWVTSVALTPDGHTAFVGEFADRRGSFDAPAAQARLWNADTGQMTLDLLKVWTPDVQDENRTDTYQYLQKWTKLIKRGLICAAFSPDGSLLAVGQGGETDKGQVHLVNVESGKIERTVSGHRYGVCDLQFSADGQLILSSGRDTTVRICQVADGKEIATLGKERGGQFKDWLSAIAISPDQTRVAAADIAGMVHVWKLNGQTTA